MTNSNSYTNNFWDDRYDTEEFVYGRRPDPFVESQRHVLRPGMKALVPGDGEGRHGVWLAEQGLDVTTVDMSWIGKTKADRLAADRGVRLNTVVANLTEWSWRNHEYDVIVSVFLHLPPDTRRHIHWSMANALRLGGYLIIVAFRPEQLEYRDKYGSTGGPPVTDMLFTRNMLVDDFSDLEVVQLDDTDQSFGDHGSHTGTGAVIQGVFRKPGYEELSNAKPGSS